MKRLMAIFALLIVGVFAFAVNIRDLGSTKYFEEGRSRFYDLKVSVDVNGIILLDTGVFTYSLSQADKDNLVKVLNEGLRLIGIAESNKTTIDFKKKLPPAYLSTSNGYVYTTFVTSGYEHSGLDLIVMNGGNNLIMNFGKRQIQDFVSLLNKSTSESDDIQRQIKLFQ